VNIKRERGQATRAELIEVATRLFAARGYEDTSIDAVLGETSVSRGALYHHFASKEALFEAVL
jgi:AcrR family transcriptional regulator